MLVPQACDLVDPTEVTNPNIVQSTQIGVPNSTILYLNGMQRQMAIVYNNHVVIAELGSDNYVNIQTFYNQTFDVLGIQFQDANINTAQFTIADLREGASFGIETLHPADPEATDIQLAELYFYRGWANLLAGELFKTLPAVAEGPPVGSSIHLENAVADFLEAEAIDGNNASYKLGLARAYYRLGDQVNAVAKSDEAIALDNSFVRYAIYDATNGPTSTIQNALYDRGNFDDLQPLPRLDFLDPKHFAISGSEDSNTVIQKIEEAYLIKAEAEVADGDVDGARSVLNDLLAVVESRAVSTIDETIEQRNNSEELTVRPASSLVRVRSEASDSLRSGLVIDRVSNAVVATLSGTSVTSGYLSNVTNQDAMLETVYLMRQEIFMAEGRRFTDLGLKMPVSETEQLSNSNVGATDIEPQIPAFLPATEMDAFTFNVAGNECTITHNMNSILVQNKDSDLVLPFH